ncbi:MAG: PQQ-dependent sugar dehydrogenase [Candidatus Moranbacteria bacterium]|nr:PQQ-dependent sugar dehydrogenase [Candidatus Moranbacteria bacterium]
MDKQKWLILAGVVLVLIATGWYFYANRGDDSSLTPQERQNQEEELTQAEVKEEFEGKIVYEENQDSALLTKDCRQRGGAFDGCGNGCALGAEVCATVCVPVCNLPGETSSEGVNKTDLPLEVPENFEISFLAENLPGARDISEKDSLGNIWISQTSEGKISLLSLNENQELENADTVFENLNRPHGLAIDPEDGLTLYFAETDAVKRVRLYTEDTPQKIADLPGGGGHLTRSLHFGPDDKLYVSIGSSCNVCLESDERRAAVYRMNKDGSNFEKYAEGLRNSVFMATNPITGDIWATEMGRDNLGDNTPPDEINILQEGGNYGWPYCYGKNTRDETFRPESNENCDDTIPSRIDLQAHSAPLGLDFVPETGWPEEYWLDLVVAYHGSWNRTVPTGYKLVHFNLDDQGNLENRQDFISGWLTENGEKLGRPVDVQAFPGGMMLVSDDQKGVVYKIEYTREGK